MGFHSPNGYAWFKAVKTRANTYCISRIPYSEHTTRVTKDTGIALTRSLHWKRGQTFKTEHGNTFSSGGGPINSEVNFRTDTTGLPGSVSCPSPAIPSRVAGKRCLSAARKRQFIAVSARSTHPACRALPKETPVTTSVTGVWETPS